MLIRTPSALCLFAIFSTVLTGERAVWGQAAGGDAPAPRARRIPEGLNFANGLFRERRYELAAKEYERFLAETKAGPDAHEARFGLANARLFQGEYAKARGQFEEFLREAPDHSAAGTAWYRVGETAYMLGDLPAARQAFDKFTSTYPGHKHLDTAWPYFGDVCLRLEDLPRARRAYEKSLELHPEGRLADRARFGLGRTLALQGQADEALAMFSSLAEKGGRDWTDRAWFQIGQVRSAAKRFDKAVEAFATVEKVAPQSPLVAESRLNRAEALVHLAKIDEAVPILRALAADGPQNVAAQAALILGTAQLEHGEADEALATLDDAAKRFSGTHWATVLTFRSAEAALKLGRGEEARARFLRAAEDDPKDDWADDALLRAARLALDQGDAQTAGQLADTFSKRYPKSRLLADARLVSARAAYTLKRYKDAITTLSDSLADDDPSPETAEAMRYYLGLAYRSDGQSAKAGQLLDALSRTPSAPIAADAQFMVGQGHIEARRFAEAVPALEKYLAAKPRGDVADYAWAHLVLARLELGETDAAIKALGELAERFPKSKALAPSRVRIGEAHLEAERWDHAAEQFRKAVAEAIDSAIAARARIGLGWALLGGGKPAEAAATFEAFAAAGVDGPHASEAALAHGVALHAGKQTDAALAAYASVQAKFPKSEPATVAALMRARLLVEAKRPAEAAQAYAKFLEDNPDYTAKEPKRKGFSLPGLDVVLAEWGWALIDADKPADADKVFTRLLDEFPESPHAADARFNLAESANQAKRSDDVIRLLTPLAAEGTKATPGLLQSGLYRLGRTHAQKKDWPSAARTLDRLLAEFPDSTFRREAELLRADVALETGDAKTADKLLAALAAEPAEPNDPEGFATAVRCRRVQSLLATEQWKEVVQAADALKADAPADPVIPQVDYARGRALMKLARYDEARTTFQGIIDARKGGELVARAQLMIGETYFHQKDYHEAIRQFLKVDILYDAPPWQAAALLETGKAYEQLAQWADAAETYERIRARFPDEPLAKDALSRLEAARKHLGEKDGGGRSS
jgi:TolA-binding protein